jgi:hypothetical protein
MHPPSPSEGPRPRTDSERLRLAAYVPGGDDPPNTDDTPTVISARPPAAARPTGPDDLRGRRLGHFELIEPVGVGGMGAVIRARDVQLGRPVALKILPPEAAADAESVSRFHAEARAAALLDHENIARVYYCGEDQGLHFIAFEFVEGLNLRTVLERSGPLRPAEAVHYMLQVATGLAHAAARGVVHRDVKPSNIIITPAGRAKIVDMGLARRADGPSDGLTASGVTLGTFDYISPEQALEPRAADVRSDIYSLGCTFYHALTGRPPVPEGTAARKLHHHQQVMPVDPRQLNPAIPDELAAVLSRMMAKDPRERYQRPEELVQHLIALARSYGPSGGSGGDPGVLYVDTPLPAPPRRLLGLLASAAVLGVAALVAVIEVTRPTPKPAGFSLARLPPPPDAPAVPPPAPAPPSGSTRAERVEVETAEQLAAALRRGIPDLRVVLTGPAYVLERPDGDARPAGLTFEGQRLVIEAAAANRPVIRYAPDDPDEPGAGPAAALTVAGRGGGRVAVELRGVRFECAARGEQPVAAVLARDLERLDVERCEFHLPDLPAGGRPGGALVVESRPGAAGDSQAGTPELKVSECLFSRGTQAVQLLGRARVQVRNCAFGPHAAVVHLRDTGGPADTQVRLEQCSAMLEGGAVVLAEDGAGGTVLAGHCLVARPPAESPEMFVGESALVRQTGTRAGVLVYQGLRDPGPDGGPQRNGYYNVTLWTDETPVGSPRRAVTLDDARRLFPGAFADEDAAELPQSPWQAARPLALLGPEPQAAFAADLRQPRLRLRDPRAGLLGVVRNVWGESYRLPLDGPGGPGEAAVRTRVVSPEEGYDPAKGVYRTLGQALEDTRPDDVILIRHNGPLEVAPVRLDRADMRVTVKAFPNYQPVLTPAPTPEADSAMFRLHDGRVTLEGLQFVLRPARPDFRSQAVAAITGGGQCQFVRCVVTLEEVEDVSLAAVALPDPDGAMRMAGERRGTPAVRFDGGFVRGKGDLVAARGGRRFELDLESSLVALDGSLVSAAGGAKDPPAGAPAQVRLRHVTAAVTEHVLDLRLARDDDRGGPGLPATQVSCADSLLVALGGRSLVHLDGAETDEQVRQLVLWGEGRQTYYGNVGAALLDVQPGATDRAPAPLDAERWLAFTRERPTARPFVRVRFAAPAPDRPLARSRPGDFRPRYADPDRPPEADTGEVGAPVDRLPIPTDVDAPAPPSVMD